jgi:F420-0:gamma-glutamyl ligase
MHHIEIIPLELPIIKKDDDIADLIVDSIQKTTIQISE